MLSREEFEEREDAFLAPYALRSKLSKGRRFPEAHHEFRPDFQRDKERVTYSTAFRRLEYKTQVFVNHEGDHYRTRLTHTLEVSLIARSLARTLRINEDLVEAIALAHDLGHSPFGHAGESALNELMQAHGGFEHNLQSLRIVEDLEDCYEQFPGLNLTWEVREGLKKHAPERMNALEFDVVDVADEIAYNAHDLNDGVRSNYLALDEVKELKIWQRIDPKIGGTDSAAYLTNARATRNLVNAQVVDVILNTTATIKRGAVTSVGDLATLKTGLVGFSSTLASEIAELKEFLFRKLYRHPKVERMNKKARETISTLFQTYSSHPEHMPPYFQKKMSEWGKERVICDYIAGMTDRYAHKEFDRLKTSL